MRLFILKLVHTLIFIAAIGTLIPFTWYAATGRQGEFAGWAALLPIGILAGIILNRGSCILQSWAKQLEGREEGWARDVFFLPESWAVRTVPVMIPVFALAIGAALLRFLLAGA